MNLLSGILWTAAIAAIVVAFIQLAGQSVRLREELEELRTRLPEPAKVATGRVEARPMFGELYEDTPSPLDGISSWPGVPLAFAAAGLFAVGMVTIRPRSEGGERGLDGGGGTCRRPAALRLPRYLRGRVT